jgi:N-acetyltransferase 10
MVRGLSNSPENALGWLSEFAKGLSWGLVPQSQIDSFKDFRRRFLSLLSFGFREFGSVAALGVLEAANAGVKKVDEDESRGSLISSKCQIKATEPPFLFGHLELGTSEMSILLTPFDLKRLEAYSNNMLDYHVILDLLPTVASLFFEKRLGGEVHLNAVQNAILLAIGLQRKTIEEVEVRAPAILVCELNSSDLG